MCGLLGASPVPGLRLSLFNPLSCLQSFLQKCGGRMVEAFARFVFQQLIIAVRRWHSPMCTPLSVTDSVAHACRPN